VSTQNLCVAVCCSVLQWVAVCCSVVAVFRTQDKIVSTQNLCVAVCCSVLQCVAVLRPVLSVSHSIMQCTGGTHTHTHTHTQTYTHTSHTHTHLICGDKSNARSLVGFQFHFQCLFFAGVCDPCVLVNKSAEFVMSVEVMIRKWRGEKALHT